jgi:outer membrane protein TolC
VKRWIALLLLLIAGRAHASRWTLEQLVQKLKKDAPNVVSARLALESAKDGLRAAQYSWLPTGDLTAGFSGSPEVRCQPLGTTDPNAWRSIPQSVREANCFNTNVVSLSSAGPLSDLLPVHGFYMTLNVNTSQQLYFFGRTEASIAAAQAQVDTAKANLEAAEAETLWYASRAYWGLKASRAAVDSIQEAIDKLKDWVDKIDTALNGKNLEHYTEADLKRMQIALAYAKTQLYDQQRNMNYAKEALVFLAGDKEADVDEEELALIDDETDLDTWQQRGLAWRPEIHSLRASDDASRSTHRMRIAEMLPTLSFNLGLQYGLATSVDTPQNYFFNRANYLNASMALNLSLGLDFGPKVMRLKQARYDLQSQLARSRYQINTYSTEIAQAYENYVEARSRAKELAHGEKISRGWYLSINSNVEAGLAEAREMVESLQNFFSFHLRGFQAIYDANTAHAWLTRVTLGAHKETVKTTDN